MVEGGHRKVTLLTVKDSIELLVESSGVKIDGLVEWIKAGRCERSKEIIKFKDGCHL